MNGSTIECCDRANHDSGSSLYHGEDIGLVTVTLLAFVYSWNME